MRQCENDLNTCFFATDGEEIVKELYVKNKHEKDKVKWKAFKLHPNQLEVNNVPYGNFELEIVTSNKVHKCTFGKFF